MIQKDERDPACGLYHTELGFPPDLVSQVSARNFRCRFTRHALTACLNDRYGKIVPPPQFRVELDEVIEIEARRQHGYWDVRKVVVRLPYNAKFDLLMAFIPDNDLAIIKTCWLNSVDDKHSTLDESKYTKLN